MCEKTARKEHQIFEKRDHFENRPSCKGYRLCKIVSLGQKLRVAKNMPQIDSTSTLELFCAKNRSQKHQIFEKWDDFENRPSCKGYRLCKMVSLGQKLRWPKTFSKIDSRSRLYLFHVQKTARKNTKYSRNETILKIGHLTKAIDFVKWSVWVQN